MTARQPTLPLGFGPLRWDLLAPEVQARVLDLWLQLLQEHVARQASLEARREVS